MPTRYTFLRIGQFEDRLFFKNNGEVGNWTIGLIFQSGINVAEGSVQRYSSADRGRACEYKAF